MSKTVYLCGGINGLSDSDCTDWRECCKEQLSHTHKILDPMRRDYRGREHQNVDEICVGDYADIAKSDIVLVNATRPSWGTAMEMHEAYKQNKLVVAIVTSNPSPWVVYHSHKRFLNTWSICEYLKKVTL